MCGLSCQGWSPQNRTTSPNDAATRNTGASNVAIDPALSLTHTLREAARHG